MRRVIAAAEYLETECGKRGYRGRASAERAAKGTKYVGQYAVRGVHAYYCGQCRYWHVGHARQWHEPRRKERDNAPELSEHDYA